MTTTAPGPLVSMTGAQNTQMHAMACAFGPHPGKTMRQRVEVADDLDTVRPMEEWERELLSCGVEGVDYTTHAKPVDYTTHAKPWHHTQMPETD